MLVGVSKKISVINFSLGLKNKLLFLLISPKWDVKLLIRLLLEKYATTSLPSSISSMPTLLEKISSSNALFLRIVSFWVLDLYSNYLTSLQVLEADGVFLQVFINSNLQKMPKKQFKNKLNLSGNKSLLHNLILLILTLISTLFPNSLRELFHGFSVQISTAITTEQSNRTKSMTFQTWDMSRFSHPELSSSLAAFTTVLPLSSRSVIITDLMI